MNNNKLMSYEGYFGSIEFCLEDKVLHGKIECINDLVTYESDNIEGLEQAFYESVDDYLETCSQLKKEPNKSMSGSFNIRIGSDLHREAYIFSKTHGMSLNEFTKISIKEKIHRKDQEVHLHIHNETKEQSKFSIETDFAEDNFSNVSFIKTSSPQKEKCH